MNMNMYRKVWEASIDGRLMRNGQVLKNKRQKVCDMFCVRIQITCMCGAAVLDHLVSYMTGL